jgi:hypothetical protein
MGYMGQWYPASRHVPLALRENLGSTVGFDAKIPRSGGWLKSNRCSQSAAPPDRDLGHVSFFSGHYASTAHSLCLSKGSGGRAAIAYVKGRRPLDTARGLCDVAWVRARCFGSASSEGVLETVFPHSVIHNSGILGTEGENVD